MITNRSVAIITGGSQGIGAATVQRFLKAGCFVAVCDIKEPADPLPDAAKCYRLNVTDSISVYGVVNAIRADFGRIDFLVNNAGITRDAFIGKMTDADFDLVVGVNLKGPFLMAKACFEDIKKSGGSITTIGSCSAHGCPGQSNYAATKSGVEGMTKTWALELARFGARANVVAPGYTDTAMMASVPEKVLKNIIVPKIPLGRLARPEEIAEAIYFVAVVATYMTGAILEINGGIVM